MSKHTPEPWKAYGEHLIVPATGGGIIAVMDSLDEDRDRILACINACAGLNPEAVPKLVEACRKIVACYEQRDGRIMHEMWEGHFIAPRRFAAARAIKDALDLAEKTE